MPAPSDDASAHVLDEAERLFLERGFEGVRLRHLANALGMKPASLYYHAPGGKTELWDRVVRRALARHRAGLDAAVASAPGDLRAQLRAVAQWLVSQPPVNVVAVATSRIAEASTSDAHGVSEQLYESLMVPIGGAIEAAQARGEIGPHLSPDLLSGVVVAALNGLLPAAHAGSLPRPPDEIARDIVDVLLDGMRPR